MQLRGIPPVAVLLALAVSVFGYASAQGSTATGITEAERHGAEFEIAHSRIVSRLQTTLGDTFGGVWFEPPTGQLHVGVLSESSRGDAEALAARAGVAGLVVETPVSSTWAELEAAQARWAERLADLFDREEVETSLRAQYNTLEVGVGALVPDSRRAALELAASADEANVLIRPSQAKYFRAVDQARCAGFLIGKAYCNPTIVAGQTIVHENETGSPCTAGPAVLSKDASTALLATERRILTAGHCIDPTGKKKWFAYNKVPEKLEVGFASKYVNNHAADIGLIQLNAGGSWRQAGFIPVNPAIALWNEAETNPIPVVGEQEPIEGAETCISGQTSGKLCGKIVATNKTLKTRSGMAEVNVVTQGGDSGAPWYSRSYAESSAGLVEGVHSGLNVTTNTAYFQPLKTGLQTLKEETGADYELLTQNNEERKHPKAVTASKYPTTAQGKGSAGTFTAFGSSVKCAESEFDGTINEESTSIELTPVYAGCTALAGLTATVTNNGCKYRFVFQEKVAEGQYKATADVVCPEGKAGIEMHVYLNKETHASGTDFCRVTVPPQTGLKTVTLTNSGESIVIDSGTIEGVRMKIHRYNKLLCPGGPATENETTSGAYDIESPITLAGSSEGKAVKIDLAGG